MLTIYFTNYYNLAELNNELELNVTEVVRFMEDKCLPLCVIAIGEVSVG